MKASLNKSAQKLDQTLNANEEISFAVTSFNLVIKRIRKREFFDGISLTVLWIELIGLNEPHVPTSQTGPSPLVVSSLLRIPFTHQCFGFSGPAMDIALHDESLVMQVGQYSIGGDN